MSINNLTMVILYQNPIQLSGVDNLLAFKQVIDKRLLKHYIADILFILQYFV